jgi:DNA mismatch repair protein MutL
LPATIKILPQYIANRIAAGEVVGRPEAVVKELIENSIDAEAKSISLRIKDAGKSLIQVSDDGIGMSEEDALLCFQRHSTSKISNADDLENIKTLGFRGEALASISAVAQVELITGQKKDEMSIFIKNHGSEIIESSVAQGSHSIKGTSVSVKNLFYNTPARRNFLKTNQTEFKHIYDTFVRQAIAYPEINFSFINEDEEVFNLKETDLRNRLRHIFGIEYTENLLEVNHDTELIALRGYISKPSFTKKSKQDQFLYLNRRYVINRSLSYAVHLAFEDLIEKGDYPNFFLFLKLDPQKFDVNVHPSKLEVKFEDEKSIFGFIKKSIWDVLGKNDLVVGIKLDKSTGNSFQQTNVGGSILTTKAFDKENNFVTNIPFKKSFGSNIHELFTKSDFQKKHSEINKEDLENTNSSLPVEEIISTPLMHKHVDSFASTNSIWQFQKKYIMYQLENTLMIIDQHAAHERILYEQAVDRLNSNANLSQQLLIPIYVELNHVDYEIVRSMQNELRSLGFDFDITASTPVRQSKKIKLNGIPADVHIGKEAKIIQEMIDEFKDNDVKLNLEKRDNLAKSYACKHAIRTGDILKEDEMLNLIDKLFSSKMPYVCPHGRPTIIKITMDELDKKFARKGF